MMMRNVGMVMTVLISTIVSHTPTTGAAAATCIHQCEGDDEFSDEDECILHK